MCTKRRAAVKVIPVTGYSGSGKTTFIRTLVPLLAKFGPVGTIKHTGHHEIKLPLGKDTTVMFATGVEAVVGIDHGKHLITARGTSLTDALDYLAGRGIAVTVIEGFKESPLPKIVIGDFEAENCILRNPEPEDVLHFLYRFPDYITMGQILHELDDLCGDERESVTIITHAAALIPSCKANALHGEDRTLPALEKAAEGQPGVTAARVVFRHGSLFGKRDELLIAIAADGSEQAESALHEVIFRCRAALGRSGIALM
jgi:molybdopterin synthase catalytic subunit